MSQQTAEERTQALRAAKKQKIRRKEKLAREQKLVFAAIFLVSLIVISPVLIHGLVKQNQEKKQALSEQAGISVSAGNSAQGSQVNVLPSTTSASDKNFFAGSLFIGDSRTVGLKEYGNMTGATFLCDIGLDAKKALEGDLPKLLSSHKYKRVYIMLGINEIGNSRDSVLKHYRTLVQYVKKHGSGAQIILMGNLHVTKDKEASDELISNRSIDSLNRQTAQIAKDYGCRYLDPNPVFDDGSGALPDKYSGDGAHLYGKYYELWKNWIVAQR